MKLNLKLGENLDEIVPLGPPSRRVYPSFHIESDEKPELPHSGTMTIRFKKTGFSMREDGDGDVHYSCDVQVHEIVDVESDEPEAPARNRSTEAGEALDELKNSRKKKSDY